MNGRLAWTLTFALLALGGANSALAAGPDIQVWTPDVVQRVWNHDRPDPAAGPPAVRVVGARNGKFAGQVLISSTSELRNTKVTAGELRQSDPGGAVIPAASARVRCLQCDYHPAARWWGNRGAGKRMIGGMQSRAYDGMSDSIPESVPLDHDTAVLPLWVTIQVPKDAAAGKYAGAITVVAGGTKGISVPVELEVADFSLPDVKDWTTLLSLYESPETLWLYYKLKPWSEEHWKCIERSLRCMGEAGNMLIMMPIVAETQYDNSEGLVYWIKQSDGSYKYDWGRFDRYIDLFLKTHPRERIKVVSLLLWGWEAEYNHNLTSTTREKKEFCLFTVLDPATGALKNEPVPEYGTPEGEAFWRPFLLEAVGRLKKKGFDKEVMLGVHTDRYPTPRTVAMFRDILPEVGWHSVNHPGRDRLYYDARDQRKSVPVHFDERGYRLSMAPPGKPDKQGWRNPRMQVSWRQLEPHADPWTCRVFSEFCLLMGFRGFGRVGADFWYFKNAELGIRGGLACGTENAAGRYPRSTVDQLSIGYSPRDLLAPGPDGTLPTQRLEQIVEGIQECEARIFIERSLADHVEGIPTALAERCRDVLRERTDLIREFLYDPFDKKARPPEGKRMESGWQERSRKLYQAAADVAKAVK